MEIKYKDYLSLKDFENKNFLLQSHYIVNKNSIRRNAITNGRAPWRDVVPIEVIRWKLSLIDTFVDFTPGNSSVKLKNIKALEESETRIISFVIGMLFAQCYAQKFLGINQLYHLKFLKDDGLITVTTKGKYPDFIGVNKYFDEVYLIEAKGSSLEQAYMTKKTIKDAAEQLESVISIVTHQIVRGKSYDKLYFDKNLNKYIVATHRDLNSDLTQDIVDPIELGENRMIMQLDNATYSYYEHVIWLLKNSIVSKVKVSQYTFLTFDIPEYKCRIGLLEELYDILENYYKEDSRNIECMELKAKVDEVLKELDSQDIEVFELGYASIGRDGIISMDIV